MNWLLLTPPPLPGHAGIVHEKLTEAQGGAPMPNISEEFTRPLSHKVSVNEKVRKVFHPFCNIILLTEHSVLSCPLQTQLCRRVTSTHVFAYKERTPVSLLSLSCQLSRMSVVESMGLGVDTKATAYTQTAQLI